MTTGTKIRTDLAAARCRCGIVGGLFGVSELRRLARTGNRPGPFNRLSCPVCGNWKVVLVVRADVGEEVELRPFGG